VSGRNRAGTWLGVRATGPSNDQWVPVDGVAYPFMELLPVWVSAAAPDTEALCDFLVEHAAPQTEATHSVSVQVQTCGRANAFAVKRAGCNYVVLCQEMLTLMWQDFASLEAAFPSGLEYTTAAASGILAVALHAWGHLRREDPMAVRGLDHLGRSIAKAQEIATRYGTTFGEDGADLYATVVLQEMAQELGAQADTRAALPTEYVALGPVMLGYVPAWHRPGSGGGTHSPSPERLATSLCVGGDGMGPVFALTLDRVAGFRERLYDLSAARGRQCLDSAESDPEAYAALLREIEDLFAASLPAWW